MEIVLIILLLVAAVLLIGAVLIQPGKGDMLSGMGGVSNQFNSALGTKKATDFLTKSTWYLAIFLIVGSVTVNLLYTGTNNSSAGVQKSATENVKVNMNQGPADVNTIPVQDTPPAPASSAPAEDNSGEDTNTDSE